MANKHKNNYAVITGASSGIGAEFARQLAAEGYNLVLVARREDRLQALAQELRTAHGEMPEVDGDKATNNLPAINAGEATRNGVPAIQIITADLSQMEECHRLISETQHLPVSIFINNAGFGDCGLFTETELDKDLSMIDVNVKALHLLTKCMLRRFQEQKGGYLLNVASSAGLIPAGPYMATYYATKAYVTSLTRAVAQELKEAHGSVYIGCLCPGPVETEFNDVAGVEFALKGISVQACVTAAIRGMKRRQVVIVPSLRMQLAATFGHHLPEAVYIRMTGHQQKKKLHR